MIILMVCKFIVTFKVIRRVRYYDQLENQYDADDIKKREIGVAERVKERTKTENDAIKDQKRSESKKNACN